MIFVSCGCTALSPTRARNVDAKKSKDVVSCELPALGSFLSTPSNSDLGRVRKWQNVFARKDAKGMFDADRGVASFLTSTAISGASAVTRGANVRSSTSNLAAARSSRGFCTSRSTSSAASGFARKRTSDSTDGARRRTARWWNVASVMPRTADGQAASPALSAGTAAPSAPARRRKSTSATRSGRGLGPRRLVPHATS